MGDLAEEIALRRAFSREHTAVQTVFARVEGRVWRQSGVIRPLLLGDAWRTAHERGESDVKRGELRVNRDDTARKRGESAVTRGEQVVFASLIAVNAALIEAIVSFTSDERDDRRLDATEISDPCP